MQQEMMLRDEETMELRGTYTSLQQEVEVKTKKLKKVRCHRGAGARGVRARQPLPQTATGQAVCLFGPLPTSLELLSQLPGLGCWGG